MREQMRRNGDGRLWTRILAAGPETVFAVLTLGVQSVFMVVGLPGVHVPHPLDVAPPWMLTATGALAVVGAVAWLVGYRWGRGHPQTGAAWDRFGALMMALGWLGSGAVAMTVPAIPPSTTVLHLGVGIMWIARWVATGVWQRRVEQTQAALVSAGIVPDPTTGQVQTVETRGGGDR